MTALTKLFGGNTNPKAATVNFSPNGFQGGGISANYIPNAGYQIGADANRTGIVGGLSDTFSTLGNRYSDLLKTVSPGFNDLLNSRLTALNNARTSAIGDLKQNLQSRRILGSSFGADTLARANADYNQQQDAIVADNFLKSLQASNALIGQQYDAYSKAFQTKLDELNLETGIASTISNNVNNQLAQNARTQATLTEDIAKSNASNNLGVVKGLGSLIGYGLTGGVSGLAPQGMNFLPTDFANNGTGIYTGPAYRPGFA